MKKNSFETERNALPLHYLISLCIVNSCGFDKIIVEGSDISMFVEIIFQGEV